MIDDRKDTVLPPTFMVTVCSACRQASCWQAVFFCQRAQTAGTIDLPVKTLRRLKLEHWHYWEKDARAAEWLLAHGYLR